MTAAVVGPAALFWGGGVISGRRLGLRLPGASPSGGDRSSLGWVSNKADASTGRGSNHPGDEVEGTGRKLRRCGALVAVFRKETRLFDGCIKNPARSEVRGHFAAGCVAARRAIGLQMSAGHPAIALITASQMLFAMHGRAAAASRVLLRGDRHAHPATATGSIRLASLFLTLPTRALTGQHIISSDGYGASRSLS